MMLEKENRDSLMKSTEITEEPDNVCSPNSCVVNRCSPFVPLDPIYFF